MKIESIYYYIIFVYFYAILNYKSKPNRPKVRKKNFNKKVLKISENIVGFFALVFGEASNIWKKKHKVLIF